MKENSEFATILKRGGISLILAGILANLTLRFVPDSELSGGLHIVCAILAFGIIVTGAFLYWRGRQYVFRASAKTIIEDQKPDVLFLRAFRSDPSTFGQVLSASYLPHLLSGLKTEEEQLCEALRPIGDVVAIGQPGENLPLPGAARMYVSNEEWKATVEKQVRAARLVVIRAGVGDGLLWELDRATRILNPQKVLIFLSMMKDKEYAAFREKANAVLPVPLQESKAGPLRRISGFISFSADWKPTLLPLRAPFFRRAGFKPYERLFKFALKPIYESFGVKWEPPRVSMLAIGTAVFGVLFALLVLFLITAFIIDRISPPVSRYPSIDRATDASAIASSEAPWKVRDLGDITLDSPLDLSTGRDSIAALSEQARPNLVYQEVFRSPDSFLPTVVVSRSKYTPETEFDMDRALVSASNRLAIASGDPDFQFSSKVTTVDSLPARHASFAGHERDGTPLYCDVVYVQNGQQLWNVRVVYNNSSFATSSKRILDSIHVRPE